LRGSIFDTHTTIASHLFWYFGHLKEETTQCQISDQVPELLRPLECGIVKQNMGQNLATL
jgi:hypothetical protein